MHVVAPRNGDRIAPRAAFADTERDRIGIAGQPVQRLGQRLDMLEQPVDAPAQQRPGRVVQVVDIAHARRDCVDAGVDPLTVVERLAAPGG